MSFGFSVNDLVSLIAIVVRAYRGWDRACGEYSDITVSLNEIRVLLSRISEESESDRSVLIRKKVDAQRLNVILSGVRRTAEELDDIIERFKRLNNDKSRERNWERLQRNWDRLRFGNTDLDGIRVRLSQHVGIITSYLETVGLGSLARIEKDVRALLIQQRLHDFRADIQAGRREGSVLTEYSDDDPHIWKEFRRELIGDGFRGSEIRRFKPRIKQCLQRWMNEGTLEEHTQEDEAYNDDLEPNLDSPPNREFAPGIAAGSTSPQDSDDTEASAATARIGTSEIPNVEASHGRPINSAADPGLDSVELSERGAEPQTAKGTSRKAGSENPTKSIETDFFRTSAHLEREIKTTPAANTAIARPHPTSPGDVNDENIIYTVYSVSQSVFKHQLKKSQPIDGVLAFCTIIVIVPESDIELFCKFAANATSLLPFLGLRLRDEGEFQALTALGSEALLSVATPENTLQELETNSEYLGLINGARVYLSSSPVLFDELADRVWKMCKTPLSGTVEAITMNSLTTWIGNLWLNKKSSFTNGGFSRHEHTELIDRIKTSTQLHYAMNFTQTRSTIHQIFYYQRGDRFLSQNETAKLLERRESSKTTLMEDFENLRYVERRNVVGSMLKLSAIGYRKEMEWRLSDIRVFETPAEDSLKRRRYEIVFKGGRSAEES